MAHNIRHPVASGAAPVVNLYACSTVDLLRPHLAIARRSRDAIALVVLRDRYDTVLHICTQTRIVLLNEPDIKHIAIVVPPAAVFCNRNLIFVRHAHAAGLLPCKFLRQIEAVLFPVSGHKVQKTGAVVVCLYHTVHVTAEPVCLVHQPGEIFTPLINGCFFTQ